MRTILSLLIIVLIALGISPFVGGHIFKRHYYDFISRLNAANPNYKVEIVQYNQGWFSSDAVTKLSPTAASPTNAFSDLSLTVNEHIVHGPIFVDMQNKKFGVGMASIHSEIPLGQITKIPLPALNNIVVKIDSRFTFGNSMLSHITVPAFEIAQPNVGKFSLQGIEGDIKVKEHNNSVSYTANFTTGAAALDNTLLKMNVAPVKYAMTYELQPQTIPQVDSNGSTDSISVSGLFNVTLNNVKVQYSMPKTADDMLDLNTMATIQSIALPNFAINTINNFNQHYSVKNISASGLLKFQNYVQTKMDSPASITPAIAQEFEAIQLGLLTSKTSLVYHLEFSTNLGNALADVNVFWPDNVPMFKTAEEFMQGVNVTADIRAGVPLVKQIITLSSKKAADITAAKMSALPPTNTTTQPQNMTPPTPQQMNDFALAKLNDLINQGYLVVDQAKNEYVLKITRDVTGLKLNGKVFDPNTFAPASGTQPPAIPPPTTVPPQPIMPISQ